MKNDKIVKSSVFEINKKEAEFKCFCIEENSKGAFYHVSQKMTYCVLFIAYCSH